jgi:hypothetical protein
LNGSCLAEQMTFHGDVFLGTVVAIVDLLFIFFVVPESLPERLRTEQKISWDKIDPFAVSVHLIDGFTAPCFLTQALRNISHDRFICLVCLIVFLSYLPGKIHCMGKCSSLFFILQKRDNIRAFLFIYDW